MGRLVKFLSHADMVKISCIDSTDIVEEARRIHKLNPTPTAAVGRVLTMASLMGSMMKNEEDRLTVQILCDGPIKEILVTTNSNGNVKGYTGNPFAEASLNKNGKLNVGAIVGSGELRIIRNMEGSSPYIGTVPLQTGEIAEDFAYYYAKSEQIPTAVLLGVLVGKDGNVEKAGGAILQVLPATPEQIIRLIESRMKESMPITQMLEENKTLEEIAKYISDDLNTYSIEEKHPIWKCDCSKEKYEKAILSMNEQEIKELLEDEKIETLCNFCNSKYTFTKEEIIEAQKARKKGNL